MLPLPQEALSLAGKVFLQYTPERKAPNEIPSWIITLEPMPPFKA